jgi:hypothetical protein
MKKLFVVSLLISVTFLIPNRCRASGTLGFSQPLVQSNSTQPLAPIVSLYVIEGISNGWYYQSWTGVKGSQWFSTDHSFMRYTGLNRLRLGVGVGYERSKGIDNTALKIYGEFDVWH